MTRLESILENKDEITIDHIIYEYLHTSCQNFIFKLLEKYGYYDLEFDVENQIVYEKVKEIFNVESNIITFIIMMNFSKNKININFEHNSELNYSRSNKHICELNYRRFSKYSDQIKNELKTSILICIFCKQSKDCSIYSDVRTMLVYKKITLTKLLNLKDDVFDSLRSDRFRFEVIDDEYIEKKCIMM